jgi:hypothetical protein
MSHALGRLGLASRGADGAWYTYTPTWSATTTSPTLGNGSLTGRWTRIGNTITLQVRIQFGSTTTAGSGSYRFTYPSDLAPAGSTLFAPGTFICYDDSSGQIFHGHTWNLSSTEWAAYSGTSGWSNTSPFTPANLDLFGFQLQYPVVV